MKNLLKITHSLIHSFTDSKLAIMLIISQLAMISCNSFVTTIDPSDLPSTDSKLVLACYISPQDTVISAKVTETKTILGTGGTRDGAVCGVRAIRALGAVYAELDAFARFTETACTAARASTEPVAVASPTRAPTIPLAQAA